MAMPAGSPAPAAPARGLQPWVIVVLVIVLLCCLCVGIIGILLAFGGLDYLIGSISSFVLPALAVI